MNSQEYQTYGGNSYEDVSNLSLSNFPPDPSKMEKLNFEDSMASQDDSPNSSNGSSPRSHLPGNRARALSLNTKGPHSRSTAHITQQQINKKRQRATPEQLIVLEEAFAMNPSPNAKMREHISSQISMTERSVQIWFQNRRAKTKLLHKKGGLDDLGFQQAPYNHRPGLPTRSFSIDQGIPEDYGSQGLSQHSLSSEAVITRLNCRSLTIGTWRRVACTSMDLVCYFAHGEPKFTYYINSGASGFKIEYAVSSIAKLDLRYVQNNGLKELGRATITLSHAPRFFMEIAASGGWKQCTDFTENQQATTELDHAMVGPYDHLKKSFTELASIYKETIELMTFEDLEDTPMPEQLAPPLLFDQAYPSVSTRSTQNTAFTTPDGRVIRHNPSGGTFVDTTAVSSRGSHRRTRSRSAPIAVDFSQVLSHSNVGGMPGYSFGQQSLRIDPTYRLNSDLNSSTATAAYDYNESLYTPTASGTPNYQDPWYISSYANTPLLDAERSQLGSPMIAAPSQFDLSAGSLSHESFPVGFPVLAQANPAAVSTIAHSVNLNQSMPELPRLNSVPEIPINGLAHFPPSQNLVHNMLGSALDISQMDFSNMPPAQPHDRQDQMEL